MGAWCQSDMMLCEFGIAKFRVLIIVGCCLLLGGVGIFLIVVGIVLGVFAA